MKIKIYLFFIILILIPSLIYAQDADMKTYRGLPNGQEIIEAAQYKDIKDNIYMESIIKMRVYSMIHEDNFLLYKPDIPVKRMDLLASLIRAIGKEEEVLRLSSQYKNEDGYYRAYIQMAKNLGIITNDELDSIISLSRQEEAAIKEKVNKKAIATWGMKLSEKNKLLEDELEKASYQKFYNSYANRLEAALWIIRAFKVEPVSAYNIQSIYKFKDWRQLPMKELPYLESLLVRNILKSGSKDNFLKSSRISKGEWADMLHNAISQNMDKSGLMKDWGKVAKISERRNMDPINQTITIDINIISSQGEENIITLVKANNNGRVISESIPVLKNSLLSDEKQLEQGDIIEYTYNLQGQIVLVEVMKYKEMKGNLLSYDSLNNTVRIADSDNIIHSFKLSPNTIITKNQTIAPLNSLIFPVPVSLTYNSDMLISIDALP